MKEIELKVSMDHIPHELDRKWVL